MKNTSFKRFKIRYFILTLLVLMAASEVIASFLVKDGNGGEIAAFLFSGSMMLYMLYQWRKHKLSFVENTLEQSMTPARWAKYIGFTLIIKVVGLVSIVAIGLGLIYLIPNLFEAMDGFIGGEDIGEIHTYGYILLVLSISIFAPIWEELFFRGILLRRLLIKYSAPVSILISAILFGLIHFGGASMFNAMLYGGFFGYVYLKTKNIFVTIILHSFTNFSSFLLLFLPKKAQEIIATIQTPKEAVFNKMNTIWVVTFIVGIAIIVVVVLWKWKEVKRFEKIKLRSETNKE